MAKNNVKNFIWNIIGLTANSFISLAFLIAVKMINGVDIAGIFTYSYSISIFFYYISLYYNRAYQIADTLKINSFNKYFTTRTITTLASFLLIILFCIISKFDLYKSSIIILLMVFKSVDSISDVFHGEIQKNNCLYKVGISYFIKSVLGFGLFFIIDLLTHNIIYSIISFSIFFISSPNH